MRAGACLLLLLLVVAGRGFGAEAASEPCSGDDLRVGCLAARALDALDALPADEQASSVATLLAVHLNQRSAPPERLLAAARAIARGKSREDRLQVLLPLAEHGFRSDPAAAKALQQQVEVQLVRLAGRRSHTQAFLQIADVCIGLTEIHDRTPILSGPWAGLYARYCKPAFFARLKTGNGFARVVHSHLQVVAHYLVQDRKAFRARLPAVVNTLRAATLTLADAEISATDREAATVITGALEVSLGSLACLFDLPEECHAVLVGAAIEDEVESPALWSSWAATIAVRGEGLAAGGRVLDGIGALEWLLARAAEPEYRSHRAAFLASAAWLADRLQALSRGHRTIHSA